jgi:hypothetical protein
MENIRVINQAGNKQDYEVQTVPRIAERIVLTYRIGNDPLELHFFRVRDVMHNLDNAPHGQVAVLVAKEDNPEHWPS